MRVRGVRTWAATLLTLGAAVFGLTACQPSIDVSRAKVSRSLPPARQVEIALVADEDERPIVPDAIKGKQVFDANCAVCHGANGDGNGPMAVTLKAPDKDVLTALLGLFHVELNRAPLPSKPINFHNRDLESVITPAILYETVTLGRPHSAMPAFGP